MKVKRINQPKGGTRRPDSLGAEEEKEFASDKPEKTDGKLQNRIMGNKVKIGKKHLGKKTEDRFVTIGGNVSGSVIITDDGRTVKKQIENK